MCGRFILTASGEELAEAFGLEETPVLPPRYNVAPTQPVAVVRPSAGAGTRALALLKWGLVPFGAGDVRPLVNARAETAASRASFRKAFSDRRCLIPANGFYEWAREGGIRRPFHLHLASGRLFAFAGLWEPAWPPGGEALPTCTILTVEPNEVVSPIHDRMPAILPPRDYGAWLDPDRRTAQDLGPLLRPFTDEAMAADPVGLAVNRTDNDGPECLAPETERQTRLF